MALSLRSISQNKLGASGVISVREHVFQYPFLPSRELALKRQLELVEGDGINVNVILVAEGNFTGTDWAEMIYGLQYMREIYSNVNICIRKIRWQAISTGDAGSYATINSGNEAFDLTDDWNGPGSNYMDIFVVRNMVGAAGWAAVRGPCDKDAKDQMTGAVISLVGTDDQTGIVFAHEVGHYLGASRDESGNHHPNANNFMFWQVNWPGTNDNITAAQGNEMRSHCFIHTA